MSDLTPKQEAEDLAYDDAQCNAYVLGCANTRTSCDIERKYQKSKLHITYGTVIASFFFLWVFVEGLEAMGESEEYAEEQRCANACRPFILESCGDLRATCMTTEGFITRPKPKPEVLRRRQ